MSADAADAAADADAAAERRLNHSIPRTYFVRGIQLYWSVSVQCNSSFDVDKQNFCSKAALNYNLCIKTFKNWTTSSVKSMGIFKLHLVIYPPQIPPPANIISLFNLKLQNGRPLPLNKIRLGHPSLSNNTKLLIVICELYFRSIFNQCILPFTISCQSKGVDCVAAVPLP